MEVWGTRLPAEEQLKEHASLLEHPARDLSVNVPADSWAIFARIRRL